MAYRLKAHFRDWAPPRTPADIIAAEPPKFGETLVVNSRGRDVTLRVTAIWTPWQGPKSPPTDGLVVVEAREI